MSSCRILAGVACLLTAHISTATAQPAMPADYPSALEAYERNHWSDAYRAMSQLADGGHAEAARIALQMKRYGSVLYGQRFEATALQEQRWAALRPCADHGAVLARRPAVAPHAC